MKIYPDSVKQQARELRRQGWSIGEINQKMKIPKNTISGWLKDICLSEQQKERIKQKIIASGSIGRPLAIKANREKIAKWKESIKNKVKHFGQLPLENPEIGKLICGLLYLCEGAKYPSTRQLQFINSDPKIIYFFINSLRKYFRVYENKFRVSVIYRYDQNLQQLINFWSNLTKIPRAQFLNSKPDIRTKGKRTLKKDYRGVCKIIYYDTSLQFELQTIGEEIIKNGAEGDRTLKTSWLPAKRSPN